MDCSLESFFHDGTAYYSLGQPDDSGVWSWKLYRQKLSGKKGGRAEAIYEPEAGTHLENISLYGTRVYASEWKEGGSGRIFSCKKNGEKPETILDQRIVTSYLLLDDILYYTDSTDGIHYIDQKNGNSGVWGTEAGAQALLSWDGKYFYADNFNAVRPRTGEEYSRETHHFMGRFTYVFEKDGTQADWINMMYMGGVNWFGPEKYLFADGDNGLKIFDKSRIGDAENSRAEDNVHNIIWGDLLKWSGLEKD